MNGKLLITGGTGSLGTAIVSRAVEEGWADNVTVLARNETKMNKMRQEFPMIKGVVGDVRDRTWLTTVFAEQNYVIHAAAIKIVPVAEANPREAILTNVLGSMNVAQAAIDAGVMRVVGVSTDKVCGPTYYGVSKRMMEAVFRQARSWGKTEFVLCRYGNVLNSANSVVPFFKSQIEKDVPFTITNFDMSRFWLSMKQAVDLVLYTMKSTTPNGTIIVPKAPAMLVRDVAKTLDPEREQVEIGIRPGERLHETLIIREEAMHTIDYGDRFFIYPPEVAIASNLPFQYEYTSDNPDKWLTSEELNQLLAES